MGCMAFLAAIFVVAAIDDPAVFIVAKPYMTRLRQKEKGGAFAPPRQGFCTPYEYNLVFFVSLRVVRLANMDFS